MSNQTVTDVELQDSETNPPVGESQGGGDDSNPPVEESQGGGDDSNPPVGESQGGGDDSNPPVVGSQEREKQNRDFFAAGLEKNGLGWILGMIPSIKSLAVLGPFFYLVIKVFAQAYIKGKFSVYGLDDSYIKLTENFFIDIVNNLVLILGVIIVNVSLYFLWCLKMNEVFQKRVLYFVCRLVIYAMEIALFWAIVFRDYHDNADNIFSCIKYIYYSVVNNKLLFSIVIVLINIVFISVWISYYILCMIHALVLLKKRNCKKQSKKSKVKKKKDNGNKIKQSELYFAMHQVAEKVRENYLPKINKPFYAKFSLVANVVVILFAVILLWPNVYDLGRKYELSKSTSYFVYCDENKELSDDINLSYDEDNKIDCYRVVFRNDEIVVISPIVAGTPNYSTQIEMPLSKLVIEQKAINKYGGPKEKIIKKEMHRIIKILKKNRYPV